MDTDGMYGVSFRLHGGYILSPTALHSSLSCHPRACQETEPSRSLPLPLFLETCCQRRDHVSISPSFPLYPLQQRTEVSDFVILERQQVGIRIGEASDLAILLSGHASHLALLERGHRRDSLVHELACSYELLSQPLDLLLSQSDIFLRDLGVLLRELLLVLQLHA